MASAVKEKKTISVIAEDWLQEDNMMLIECWCRDGYTMQDIANRIGISRGMLYQWCKKYPEFGKAMKNGREIIDYKVENALLKSALGYHTKEVKVITTMRYGKVVETVKEVTDKEQSPNVSAIQCWLYNRLPDKWKKNRDQIIELNEEDTQIQVTVTRAGNNESHQKAQPSTTDNKEDKEDKEWQEEVNKSITIRNKSEEEKEQDKKAKMAKEKEQKINTKVELEPDDLDYWPDDWEEE